MSGRYASAPMRLLEGGDHALSDFDEDCRMCCASSA